MSLAIIIMKKDNPSNPIYESYGLSWLQNIMSIEDPNGNYWEAQFDFNPTNLKNIKKAITKINEDATKILRALDEVELKGCENFKYWGGTA